MQKISSWIRDNGIILSYAVAKLLIHLVTATNYGFQRDAYLYMAQSQTSGLGIFQLPLPCWPSSPASTPSSGEIPCWRYGYSPPWWGPSASSLWAG